MNILPANTAAENLLQGPKMPNAPDTRGKTPEQLRDIAEDFESFVLFQALQIMTPPPSEDPIFGGGFGEEQFRQSLNEELAETITEAGGIGIADQIYGQLIKLQEVQ